MNRELLDTHEYTPARVWNMDETGINTVQKSGKVIAPKGEREVGKVTSAERGTLVTLE